MSLIGDNDVAKVISCGTCGAAKGQRTWGARSAMFGMLISMHKNSIKCSPARCPASPAQSNTLLLAALPHLLNQIFSCSLPCLSCPIKYSPALCPASPAQSNTLLLALPHLPNQILSCSLPCLTHPIKYSPVPKFIDLWRRHIRHNQTVRQAVEYCTIYLNPVWG